MNKMKILLDYQLDTKPFLLINKEQSVPSWLGAITTIVAYLLAILLCLSDIEEVFYKTTPTIVEDYFYPIEEENINVSIPIDKNFPFRFLIRSLPSNDKIYALTLKNQDIIQAQLSLNTYTIEDGYEKSQTYSIDLMACPDKERELCNSPNQTQKKKKKMNMFIGKKERAKLLLNLIPCRNDISSVECEDDPYLIYDLLSDIRVEMTYLGNGLDLKGMLKNKEHSLEKIFKETFYTSINNPNQVFKLYKTVNFTEYSPMSDLVSAFHSPEPKTIFIVDKETESYCPDCELFQASFGFDFSYKGDDNTGDLLYYDTKGTSYSIKYKSIPELWASFSSMKDLLFFLIPIGLNFIGYFEGNFYSELIHSFFGENDKYSSINRKKIINVYDTKNPGTNELFNVSSPINDEKNEKLIKPRGIKFSRMNKIWDGTITKLFSCCFRCSYFKSHEWKENNAIYNQAKKVIDNYIDIIFIMKKNLEFELMQKDENVIKPKLISGIDANDDSNFYKSWLQEQKNPI